MEMTSVMESETQTPPARGTLEQTISPLGAWALALGCIAGWGAFVMPAESFLPQAGPLGTLIAFVAGALIMSDAAMNFGYLARTHTHANGMYGYVRAAFGPTHAFVCSWCLILVYSAAMAANATALAVIARSVAGPVLQFGFHYNVAGYEVYLGEVLSAALVIVAVGLVNTLWMRLAGKIQTALALGMMVGAVALFGMAVSRNGFTLERLAPLFSPQVAPLNGTLAVVGIAPWAFVGFESVCQSAEECRFDTRHFGRIMIAAILCGGACYVLLTLLTAAAVPEGFANWADYLSHLPELTGLQATPTLNAALVAGGNPGLGIAVAVALCLVLTGVIGFSFAASRLVLALAQEGTISRRLSGVDARHGTPVGGTVGVSLVAIVGVFFGRTVLSWFVDLLSLGSLVAYAYASLATIIQAHKEGKRGMQICGAVGVVLTAVFLGLLLIPGLGSSPSEESYIILLTWIALGVNYYKPRAER